MTINERILVVSSNTAVFTKDLAVFACPDDLADDTTGTVVPAPGRAVVWNPRTKTSLDATTVAGFREITISVGRDTNNDGVSDELRNNSGEILVGNPNMYVNAVPAAYGAAHIKVLTFNCTTCDESYSFGIGVDDNDTRNMYPDQRIEPTIWTIYPPCAGCTTCSTEDNCKDVVCLARDAVNGIAASASCKVVSGYRHKKGKVAPVTALRLWDADAAWNVYCLNPIAGEPGKVDGINTVDYTNPSPANDDTITVDLTEFQDANGYFTYAALDRVVKKLKTSFGIYGDVAWTKGAGNGPAQLIISSCAGSTVVVDDTADSPIDACVSQNLLAAFAVTNDCVDCEESGSGTHKHNCGIAFVADPVKLDCSDCHLAANQKQMVDRILTLFVTGDNWKDYRIADVQAAVTPKGLGYFWKYREYLQDVGGSVGYLEFNDWLGRHGVLSGNSRSANTTVDCDEFYGVISIGSAPGHMGGNALSYGQQFGENATVILVPKANTTAANSITGVINAWTAVYAVGSVGAISLTSTNAALPNGDIR